VWLLEEVGDAALEARKNILARQDRIIGEHTTFIGSAVHGYRLVIGINDPNHANIARQILASFATQFDPPVLRRPNFDTKVGGDLRISGRTLVEWEAFDAPKRNIRAADRVGVTVGSHAAFDRYPPLPGRASVLPQE
jgi:hypothetical protein